MNILRIIGSMDPASGGPCQGIRNSCNELQKMGVHNEVVCLNRPDADFLGKDSFPIHAVGPGKGPWNYAPKLIPWLSENIGRFDAVIVHGLWLYPSYAAIKALKRFKARQSGPTKGVGKVPRLFIMPHGMLDPYFQKAEGRKLKALRNWLYWKVIEGDVVKQADGVLFTCQAELELARTTFSPYRPSQEINVGYGIVTPPAFDLEMRKTFLDKCPGLGEQPYWLFLSRIHQKKGVDLLVEAYRNILLKQQELGGEIPKLVIAGPKLETAYGQKIRQMVDDDPLLKKNVFLPGMLAGNAKWGAFYGCEAFALPSHQENFGIAVVEALACDRPVLISDQVNIWREIEAARCGIVTPDTLEGTQQALTTWLRLSTAEKEKMNQRARAAFEREFAIPAAAQRLWEVVKPASNSMADEKVSV
ncbi:glycosyltransferase [Larkinella arboricola]